MGKIAASKVLVSIFMFFEVFLPKVSNREKKHRLSHQCDLAETIGTVITIPMYLLCLDAWPFILGWNCPNVSWSSKFHLVCTNMSFDPLNYQTSLKSFPQI